MLDAHGVIGVRFEMVRHEWAEKSIEVQLIAIAGCRVRRPLALGPLGAGMMGAHLSRRLDEILLTGPSEDGASRREHHNLAFAHAWHRHSPASGHPTAARDPPSDPVSAGWAAHPVACPAARGGPVRVRSPALCGTGTEWWHRARAGRCTTVREPLGRGGRIASTGPACRALLAGSGDVDRGLAIGDRLHAY